MNTKSIGHHTAAGRPPHESLLARAAKCAPEGNLVSRRACPRWAVRAPVILRYLAADGSPHLVEGQIEDLSNVGVGLQSHEGLPVGTQAEVLAFFPDGQCRSHVEVVYSAKDFLGFRIGCRFVTGE